jgi:hypothetical protein
VEKINCSVNESVGKFTAVFTAGVYSPNSPWRGIIKLFPARESLVSDIPAGDGKTANLFLQCRNGGEGEGGIRYCFGVKLIGGTQCFNKKNCITKENKPSFVSCFIT